MDARQLIKDKILQTATLKAEEILAHANDSCKEASNALDAELAERQEAALAAAKVKRDEITRQAQMLAGLDNKKALLSAKRGIVDRVFDGVFEALSSLNDKDYAKLMTSVAVKYAASGDSVIVSAADKSRLGEKWLDEVRAKSGCKLTLSSATHNERGGIILRSEKCDKKLTLDTLVREAREQYEHSVIERLF